MLTTTPTQITGHIHSLESCGTVDGPGIRFVIFTQGCPLRCLYCHNPDCRHFEDGKEVTVEELITEIKKYRSYMRFSGGGVTVTGGEPLMQPQFVAEIFKQCQALGIHTALDTSGYVPLEAAKPVLEYADLVLLDIKSFKPEIYRTVTSVSVEPTLKFAQYLSEINKPTWIRFVLVPNLTDPIDNIKKLAEFVAGLHNVEVLEVLPFHQMGAYKWEQLGYEYQLQETKPPTPELIASTIHLFQSYGIKVSC
jgi:pyruvate formate lyase activating enzyme